MKTLSNFLAALILLPVFVSCQGNTTGLMDRNNPVTSRNNNTNNTSSDATEQFVQNAAQDGLFEIQAGRIAQEKSNSQKVKDMAQMIVNDHQNANQELRDIARKNNWTVPGNTSDELQDKLQQLRTASSDEFDAQYVQNMVDAHRHAIDKFEHEASTTDNQDLKDWINKTLLDLRKHLEKAKQLNDNF